MEDTVRVREILKEIAEEDRKKKEREMREHTQAEEEKELFTFIGAHEPRPPSEIDLDTLAPWNPEIMQRAVEEQKKRPKVITMIDEEEELEL